MANHDPADDLLDGEELPKSRTQIKNEATALQQLGAKLCDLNKDQLSKIPLPETLQLAIVEMGRIKTNSAKRRHMQFIGRLMREADHEAIAAAYQGLMQVSEQHVLQQHLAERWRDRFIADGDDAINEFMLDYPQADRQQLRQLVRTAKSELERSKPPAAARKVFRAIRDTIVSSSLV
ncbi:ribosome biogenesis factor YjgA [Simiduia curdlanivorans]|uniref:Dual-action ribosomal maturation protein DarP n=1 Tax=Simiduia curdlanivorans TaxID=1492769 RepID=A0ABV8V794_9GAMM|nr:ribosome biogenesis factor YjgA [Simiduia curdlanivorans]MDN3638915.1 ribosome biogenesis factor YjgA [Simiduia curdlanivorans]